MKRWPVIAVLGSAGSAVACASILGIEPGQLETSGEAGIPICVADGGDHPNTATGLFVQGDVGQDESTCGDEASPCKTVSFAVTKAKQRVVLKSGMWLSDHPGLLWPKIEDEKAALRLALGGAIPDTALDYENVATFAARWFLMRYPKLLLARYKLKDLPASPSELLEAIGRRRGALRPGGVVDVHKAADALIHDFRSGVLGRISLEEPKAIYVPAAPSE